MIHYWAAEATTTADPIVALLQWGALGVILALLLLGWLVPKPSYDQMRADRDQWRSAFEKERDAHGLTREALADSTRVGAAAVETSKTTTALLERLGHKTSRTGDA